MSDELRGGDRCYYVKKSIGPDGKAKSMKLRGFIVDFLPMKTKGESGANALVPFTRRKKVTWIRRGDLRKLPPKKSG